MELVLSVPPSYPSTSPTISFKNPRGLSEEQLNDLRSKLKDITEELSGEAMLFQLIDKVQDYLTTNNRPSSECPICLSFISEGEEFYTTKCYHHYHSYCLGVYLSYTVIDQNRAIAANVTQMVRNMSVQEVPRMLCPVCRVYLGDENSVNIDKLVSASPPKEHEEDLAKATAYLNSFQEKRQALDEIYKKQSQQGGIVDQKVFRDLAQLEEHEMNTQLIQNLNDIKMRRERYLKSLKTEKKCKSNSQGSSKSLTSSHCSESNQLKMGESSNSKSFPKEQL